MTRSVLPEVFDELVNTPCNRLLEKAIENDDKVIGYTCSYVPEPMISVAGLQPVRMRAPGVAGTPMADSYLSSVSCPYIRSLLEFALEERYDFLDGWVFTASCDHLRRLYDKSLILEEINDFHPVLYFYFLDSMAHLDFTLCQLSFNIQSVRNIMNMQYLRWRFDEEKVGDRVHFPEFINWLKKNHREKFDNLPLLWQEIYDEASPASYRSFRIAIDPESYHPLPAKFFEYCSCGIPVIATAHEDSLLASIIKENDIGKVVSPMDVIGLTRMIEWFYHNMDIIELFGRRARNLIEKQYDRKVISQNLVDILEELTTVMV